MLLEITIKNFAIIEGISLNFENGMTVLTGERVSFQSNKILPWLVSWKIMGFLSRMN